MKIFVLIVSLIILSFQSCSPTEPPVNSSIGLNVELVSSTEAWLKINIEGASGEVIVNKDEQEIKRFAASKPDTTIYIDSLIPNKTYTFDAQLMQNGSITARSEKVTAVTLDTTSHDFTWETFTFGGGGESSVFNDIAIINDTLAYGVGEVYLNDSTGKSDLTPYCYANWNGVQWQLGRLKFFPPGTIGDSLNAIGMSVFANSSNDIWVSAGAVFHWDGSKWSIYYYTGADGANKIWCDGEGNCWFVGNSGSIIHYSNGTWQKLESGTSTIITDIWGIVNNNNEVTAYCPVSSFFTPGDKKILRIKNNKVDSISWKVQRLLYSVWTNNEQFLYVCGSGTYENKKGYWEEINLPLVSMNAIRGKGLNDIFVVGDFGLVAHFNGSSWHVYNSLYNNNTGYGGVSVKGNIVMMTGERNGQGIITIGRRN